MRDELLNSHPIRCYAQPETEQDRYTIIFMDEPDFLGAGKSTCFNSYGESGWTEAQPGSHLGKRVPFRSLPPHLQREVERYCSFKIGRTELV